MRDADPALKAKAQKVYDLLCQAYGVPDWQPRRSGFEQLIHTILSANTNDRNTDKAYEALKSRFDADWDAVRTAPIEDIKEAIRTAGMYNQKGPHIVETLEILHEEVGRYSLDHIRTMEPAAAQAYLQRLPGVGHKTASIVLLFSYGMAAFPVDTHVQRVTQRLGISGRRASALKIKNVWEQLLPSDSFFTLHVNQIQHGRAVCKARNPGCADCVLHADCDYKARRADWSDDLS